MNKPPIHVFPEPFGFEPVGVVAARIVDKLIAKARPQKEAA
jgi:hypothetical protein